MINLIYLLALLLSILASKVDVKKSQLNDTIATGKGSGSGSESTLIDNGTETANRSRKDYIIAIEDNAPMDERVDPVFQSLQRLAKRTRGKLAVMDYENNGRALNLPFDTRLGYRNEIANDNNDFNDDDYDDDDDGDDDFYDNENFNGYNEEFDKRLGGKQRLIGANVIKNLLGLKLTMEEDRPRQKDEVQRTDELNYEDKNSDFVAPSVVYEVKGNKRDDYANYADDDEESDGYSKTHEPIFLFGNDRK